MSLTPHEADYKRDVDEEYGEDTAKIRVMESRAGFLEALF